MLVPDRIFQGVGDRGLPYYGIKGDRPVFSCRNNKIFHVQLCILRISKVQKYVLIGEGFF